MVMGMPDESDPGMSAGGTRDISGSKKTMKILADLGLVGLSFLPAGAAIRGGQLFYKGMQGAKAAKEMRKLKAVQDAIKAQKPAPGTPTTITAPKPRVRVPAGTSRTTTSGPATRGSRKPPRAPGLAKNRQRVDNKPTAPKPAPKTKPKAKPNAAAAKKRASAQRTVDTLLGTLVAGSALGVASKAVSPTKPKADPKKTAPKKRAKPGGTNKGADPKKAKPKARGPQTRGSVAPQKTTPRASGPSTRSGAKRGATKIVTAGKNVGFGPKGNIFPKDAADRRRLMAKYGGTGSAAAKAAAAGKQGNLRKKK